MSDMQAVEFWVADKAWAAAALTATRLVRWKARQSRQKPLFGIVDRSRHCCEHKENRCNGTTAQRRQQALAWDERMSTTIARLPLGIGPISRDLFGKQGACYGCWCTHFRLTPAERPLQ